MIAFGIAVACCCSRDGETGWWRAPAFGLSGGLVLYGLSRRELDHAFRLPRGLQWIGGASYSIYLTHWTTGGLLLMLTQRWKRTALLHAAWILLMLARIFHRFRPDLNSAMAEGLAGVGVATLNRPPHRQSSR